MKKPASFKMVLNNLFEEANEDDEESAIDGSAPAVTDPTTWPFFVPGLRVAPRRCELPAITPPVTSVGRRGCPR